MVSSTQISATVTVGAADPTEKGCVAVGFYGALFGPVAPATETGADMVSAAPESDDATDDGGPCIPTTNSDQATQLVQIIGTNGDPACSAPKYANARAFIHSNLEYANEIASQLNTAAANILAVSGLESGWGRGFLITAGTNNYFSLTAGPAFSGTIGTYEHNGYTYGEYDAPGFLTSGQSFAGSYFGSRVNGISDPLSFAKSLNNKGSFNSEHLATPYDVRVVKAINLVNRLIGCF